MRTYLGLLLFAMFNMLVNLQAGEHSMSIVTTETGDIILPIKVLEQFPFFRFQQQDTHDQHGPFVCHINKKVAHLLFDRFARYGMRDAYNEQALIQQLELLVALDYVLVPPTRLLRFARDLKIMVEEHAPLMTLQQKTVLDTIAPDQGAGLIQKGCIGAQSLNNETLELNLLDLGTYEGLELLRQVSQIDVSRVRNLNLSGNLFTDIAPRSILKIKGIFPQVESVDLSQNMICKVTSDDIARLRTVFPALKRLSLNNNRIQRIERESINFLEGLVIQLERNPLSYLPFFCLRSVENFSLSIANTPLAADLLLNHHKKAPGFTLDFGRLRSTPTGRKKISLSLRSPASAREMVRILAALMLVALDAGLYITRAPSVFSFTVFCLLVYVGAEYVLLLALLTLNPTIKQFDEASQILMPLDWLVKRLYNNYLQKYQPVVVSYL